MLFSRTILLDADQEVPSTIDRVFMKFRFYYEDPSNDPNYQNAFFAFRDTEHGNGEYDVVKCPAGTPPDQCVHTVIGNYRIRDIMRSCGSRADTWCSPSRTGTWPESQFIQFLRVSPHCHAPSCISMEMINADTNKTICKTTPLFGTAMNETMNEAGYLAGIPPCVWGYKEDGLLQPPVVSLDTNITVIAKENATTNHFGQMGHWQMRAAWYDCCKNPLKIAECVCDK